MPPRQKAVKKPGMVLKWLSLALDFESAKRWHMKARLVKFGEIEVKGKRYTHDVVIEGGTSSVVSAIARFEQPLDGRSSIFP